jgi:DNA-binding NarL/FixJ family response regulator
MAAVDGMIADPSDIGGASDTPIRVLVADDDALVRSALTMMLAGVDGVLVVGEVTDGDEVLVAVEKHSPDVVLMDIRMPRLDGLQATELLRRRPHPPEVIVLTTFDADHHVLRALRAGASGFLLKDTPPADIVAAVRTVAAGDPMLSASVTRRLIAHATATARDTPGSTDSLLSEGTSSADARTQFDSLSDREREVAQAISRGLSNAEIAGELYMSVATVKSYVTRILTKLDLNNRVQIALLAQRVGR